MRCLAMILVLGAGAWSETNAIFRAVVQSSQPILFRNQKAYRLHVVSTPPEHRWDVLCSPAMAALLKVGQTYSVYRIFDHQFGRQLWFATTIKKNESGRIISKGPTCVIDQES